MSPRGTLALGLATVPIRRSNQSGKPRESTAATRPSFASNAKTRSSGGTASVPVHTTESMFGYAVTRATPPPLGTRSTSASGPRAVGVDVAVRVAGGLERSPPEQAASTSADAMSERTLQDNVRARASLAHKIVNAN